MESGNWNAYKLENTSLPHSNEKTLFSKENTSRKGSRLAIAFLDSQMGSLINLHLPLLLGGFSHLKLYSHLPLRVREAFQGATSDIDGPVLD